MQIVAVDLNAKELDLIVGKICIECGIKLPSVEMVDLCMISWHQRFKNHMTIDELKLAFDMHINGQLDVKINHYQCFTREWFCDVLNLYLKKKRESHKPEYKEIKSLPISKDAERKQALKYAIDDYVNYHEKNNENFSNGYPLHIKLKYLSQILDLKLSDAQQNALRTLSIQNIINRLSNAQRSEAVFGKRMELKFQIERLKNDIELRNEDCVLIECEANRILYKKYFDDYEHEDFNLENSHFITHLKKHING